MPIFELFPPVSLLHSLSFCKRNQLTESRGWVGDGFPYRRLFCFQWSGSDHDRRRSDGWWRRFYRSLGRRREQGRVLRADVVVDASTVCAIGRQDLRKLTICSWIEWISSRWRVLEVRFFVCVEPPFPSLFLFNHIHFTFIQNGSNQPIVRIWLTSRLCLYLSCPLNK